ncbi:Calcineurin-like phosphoesterase [Persephonella hydrogeniphila]|uniref:Calcineurin-like phosphoesterase n=1 Tax=Persephonella hydrogeniphila TaxID=198703 RepID=A0A285N461_9AQUI|nr:metallophosphoesterase [Persephonella hydrogeniphila]SNZ02521.1 Calcineurin-like phosphoesterase [Persephonella hydrogeniphila]
MDDFLNIKTEENVVVVGDVHGCYLEFLQMLDEIKKMYGEKTLVVSVGDTVDRGDFNVEMLNLCFRLKEEGNFIEVQSNHNLKLYRWFKGKKVNISYGMKKTVDQILSLPEDERNRLKEKYINYYETLPLYLIINSSVVVAHAGIKDDMLGKVNKKIKDFVIYGETTGRYTEEGFPERVDWTRERVVNENSPKIVYGHVVYKEPYINNLCYGIDTGCVLGNKLTGYNPFTDEFIFIKAKRRYFSFS